MMVMWSLRGKSPQGVLKRNSKNGKKNTTQHNIDLVPLFSYTVNRRLIPFLSTQQKSGFNPAYSGIACAYISYVSFVLGPVSPSKRRSGQNKGHLGSRYVYFESIIYVCFLSTW